MPQIHFAFQPSRSAFVRPLQRLAILTDVLKTKCNTQSFLAVCDSPSPGTSWRNRENPAPLRAHASATIGTETVTILGKVKRMQLCAFFCLLCGQETHASTTQSDPLLLPTRNGRCRKDGALHWKCLF